METLKLNWDGSIPQNFTGIVERFDGTKIWYKEGKCHREDGPALLHPNRVYHWFKEGNHHRIDGPAIEYANGSTEWWIDDFCYYVDNGNDDFNISKFVFMGKEIGMYNLTWLKFFTEEGIEEFPLIPGMKKVKNLVNLYNL